MDRIDRMVCKPAPLNVTRVFEPVQIELLLPLQTFLAVGEDGFKKS